MIIIYKNDGSIFSKSDSDYIQQGSNDVNKIFVGFVDNAHTTFSCVARFIRANDTETTQMGVTAPFTYNGYNYLGWVFNLTSEETKYAGNLRVFISFYDAFGGIQNTYITNLIINATGYPATGEPIASITTAEFNSFMAQIAAKQPLQGMTSVVVEQLPTSGVVGVLYFLKGALTDKAYSQYIWNGSAFVWVGSLVLDTFATLEEQRAFEEELREEWQAYYLDLNNQWNAYKQQVDNKVNNALDMTPIPVATVNDLPPQGATQPYVVAEDGYWYYWNGSSWVQGQQYQAVTGYKTLPAGELNTTLINEIVENAGSLCFVNIEGLGTDVTLKNGMVGNVIGKGYAWYESESGTIILWLGGNMFVVNDYSPYEISNYLSAKDISFDNSSSGLEADNVQDAIDETHQDLNDFKGKKEYFFSSGNAPVPTPLTSTFNGWLCPMVKTYAGDKIESIETVLTLEPSTAPVKCLIMDANKNIIKEITKECVSGELSTFEININTNLIPTDEFRIGFVNIYSGGTARLMIAGYNRKTDEYNEFMKQIETAYTTNGGTSWQWMNNVGGDNFKNNYFAVNYIKINDSLKESVEELTYLKDELTSNTQFGKESHPNINLFNIKTISPTGEWYSWDTGLLEKYPENNYIKDFCHSDFIEIEGGETYTYSGGVPNYPSWIWLSSYCFYDRNKTFISGGSISQREQPEGYQLIAPANAKYITLSFPQLTSAQANVQLEKGDIKTAYQPYYGGLLYLNNVVIKASQIENNGEEKQNKYIRLPEKYDLVVGDTFQLFYKGVLDVRNYNEFDIDCKCDVGKFDERKFYITPTNENVGVHNLTIVLYDKENNELDKKTVSLNIVTQASSPATQKNILCMGDSLTAGGEWVNELYRRLTQTSTVDNITGLGLSNIRFVGKKTTTLGAGYEGTGGWTIDNYLSTEQSPFAYNGVINFNAYCQELGISTIDEVFILLNWNTYWWTNDNYESKTMEFINLLRQFNSNIKVNLIGIQIPSYDGLGDNYGCSNNNQVLNSYRLSRKFVFDRDELLAQMADDYDLKHISIAGQFDTEYNMPMADKDVNTRNNTKIKVGINGVHPALGGYKQIADAVYRFFNANI